MTNTNRYLVTINDNQIATADSLTFAVRAIGIAANIPFADLYTEQNGKVWTVSHRTYRLGVHVVGKVSFE